MQKHYNIYTTMVISLLFVLQIISGCATTVTKDLRKEELYKKDVQKVEEVTESLHKEELVKEELQKEDMDLVSQKLYRIKCSLCHDLPDTNTYPYTPEQWISVIDNMHDTNESRKFITVEEENKIKDYLGKLSQAK